MQTPSAQRGIATIEEFISTVGQTKIAETPLSEPGSIGGPTEHPVKNVDDHLQAAPEGSRSKENTKDVKEDQGAPSVENAKAAAILGGANRLAKRAEGSSVLPAGCAEEDQIQIGTKKAPTGEDPKSETASAKAGKKDPGSSHEARTDNDSLDGFKYASADANTPLENLVSLVKQSSDNVCALINALSEQPRSNGQAAPTSQPAKQAAAPANGVDPDLAYAIGDELAGLVTGTMDKRAADQMVRTTLAQVVKRASDMADAYISFAHSFYAKQAEGAPTGAPAGGSPASGGGNPSEAGGSESDMLSALGGAGGAGGEPSGGDPSGGAGGGMDPQIQAVVEQLLQSGMTPEQIIQELMAGEQGGAGGDSSGGDAGPAGPPGAGTPPSPGSAGGGAPPSGGMEVQSAVRNLNKKARAALASEYIKEVIARSKR